MATSGMMPGEGGALRLEVRRECPFRSSPDNVSGLACEVSCRARTESAPGRNHGPSPRTGLSGHLGPPLSPFGGRDSATLESYSTRDRQSCKIPSFSPRDFEPITEKGRILVIPETVEVLDNSLSGPVLGRNRTPSAFPSRRPPGRADRVRRDEAGCRPAASGRPPGP